MWSGKALKAFCRNFQHSLVTKTVFCSVLCLPVNYYDPPREWPTCVKPCGRDALPAADPASGLEPYEPKADVPVGQSGQYICVDRTLGVNEGAENTFDVRCSNETEGEDPVYVVPEVGRWPACMTKTTTVSPGKLTAMATGCPRTKASPGFSRVSSISCANFV